MPLRYSKSYSCLKASVEVFEQQASAGSHHGVVRLHRVVLEVLWESSQEQLVEDTPMIDPEVVVDLVVSPARATWDVFKVALARRAWRCRP